MRWREAESRGRDSHPILANNYCRSAASLVDAMHSSVSMSSPTILSLLSNLRFCITLHQLLGQRYTKPATVLYVEHARHLLILILTIGHSGSYLLLTVCSWCSSSCLSRRIFVFIMGRHLSETCRMTEPRLTVHMHELAANTRHDVV